MECLRHPAWKKPIIVSHSRGITDYVTHLENAFVVKAHNPEALSTAIKEVYADENLRNNLSSRAYEAVKTNTNLGSFVDNLVKEIYSTIENH